MEDRIIYHIDVNSAFLSWQACSILKLHPDATDIRTIPAVIGGNEETRHGIVLAKSPLAKKAGIQTGEPLMSARKKCPGLTVVSPDYREYVKYSAAFMDLLKRYAPVVEQYSIDEAFCDMTGTVRLYGDPVVFARKLKDIIRKELNFTVNIGVSTNKLLAKMASDFEKPDKVHTLFPEEIPEKMWPLPVKELFFVGRASAGKLASLGIRTIGELANTDVELLKNNFKKHGEIMWNYANGHDLEIVTDHQAENKSYGNSITIPYDVTDMDTARIILLSLCETVGARIRASKAYISVVSVTIVGNDFSRISRQRALDSTTCSTEKIYETACKLLEEAWNKTPIRLLGVSTGKATRDSYEQISLFDSEKSEKLKKLDSAIDKIRTNYGEDSVMRASFLSSEHTHMTQGINRAKRTSASNSALHRQSDPHNL